MLTQWTSIYAKITHFTDFQRMCIWTKVSCVLILFEYTTRKFTLVLQRNFFKTRKNYYNTLRMHKKTQPVNSLSAVLSLHCRDAMFHMFLWCSLTNNTWSHDINDRKFHNNRGAKVLWKYWFFFEGPRRNYQWRHHISRNGYLLD